MKYGVPYPKAFGDDGTGEMDAVEQAAFLIAAQDIDPWCGQTFDVDAFTWRERKQQ